MATKTGIATLSKADQKTARSEMSLKTRKLRAEYRVDTSINAGVSLLASGGAAFLDHRFRKGSEGEARLELGEKFRPQVNAVIGLGALLFGVSPWSGKAQGSVLAIGTGFGGPATYAFTRRMLARA